MALLYQVLQITVGSTFRGNLTFGSFLKESRKTSASYFLSDHFY